MQIPEPIRDLVKHFDSHQTTYLSGKFKETDLRHQFVDPMFECMGWDIYNKQKLAEPYKDVIQEDSIKIGGATKAPDYCFTIHGNKKFFLEAKKPSVNLKNDPSPAYQLRRYGWSAKLPLSILTDFEEFAVYDCRIKPNRGDRASKARILYLHYTDYLEQWETLTSIFSKDAILKGAFDKYAEGKKKKRGTAEVDAAFLDEINGWRDALARNLALRNPALTPRELNFAVQKIIDRIIFLRMCEDRGIEFYGRLQALQNGTGIYSRLGHLFKEADDRYNSGLFHFKKEKDRPTPPDDLSLSLKIDDKILKDIFKNLYYPDSPYEFSVLPTEILGQVYEQFLGKIIRVTPGKRAVVEDKPEVKKAGGVYYTPSYIVDYIVNQTVGKLLQGKKPGKALDKIKILDPACGSGSFLIGAYQYLLNWHRDYYANHGAKKQKQLIYQVPGGEWRLVTSEKKRILLTHIFGVDIDTQAVEVTKLSLLLKVLEGESGETLKRQMSFWRQRALPDLGGNIKCGNSLIGSDFYKGRQMSLLDEEELYRINAFDWDQEFPGIMQAGGFDAVIGNPPYVRQEFLGKNKEYFQKTYEVYTGVADLYAYFIERGISLLKKGGLFSFIVSNKWMRANYGKALRDFIATQTTLEKIVDFGELPVFQNASAFPAILVTRKRKSREQTFLYVSIKRLDFLSLDKEIESNSKILNHRSLHGGNWTLASREELGIIEKMKNFGTPLRNYIKEDIYYGIKTGCNKAFVINSDTRWHLIQEDPKSIKLIKPLVVGDDIRKYKINFKKKYLILIPNGWTKTNMSNKKDAWKWFKTNYKGIACYLEKFVDQGRKRWDQGEYWWELRPCDYYEKFEKQKIIYPDICKESRAAFDPGGLYLGNTAYFIPSKNFFLLGLLNSKLIFLYLKRTTTVLGDADKKGRLRWFRQDLLRVPILSIEPSGSKNKSKQSEIIRLVTRIIKLNKKSKLSKTENETNILQRQIEATDRAIDQLVYELYELTPEEIALVEASVP